MELKDIQGFMTLEKRRDDIAEQKKKENDAKQRIKKHG